VNADMRPQTFTRLPASPRFRAIARRIGVAGISGIAILFACAAFYAAALRPAERELAAQRDASRPGASRPAALDVQGDDLRRFYALFPPAEKLPDEVERLFALARASNLQLLQGEYRTERRPAGLIAYRVVLPVRGSYAQIRAFVGELLTGMPIASLDALRFERKKSAEAQLDAQLRITIHFRPAEENP
jgi:hypothetical protein